MYGYVIPSHRSLLESREICGVWFAAAEVNCRGPLAGWRRRRMFRLLHRRGITRCILPAEWEGEAAAWGLRPVAVHPLRQALLPRLLDRQGDLRRAAVTLHADYVSAAVSAAAVTLAARVRYLRLETGSGTDRLADMLRRRYGLCAGYTGHPALTVSFGGIPPEGAVICLGPDCTRFQRLIFEPPRGLPPDTPEQLLAALLEAGGIKKEEIYAKTIAVNA